MTLVLGLFGLFSTKPWESDSLAPKLEPLHGLGAALGEAVEVAPAGGPSVAQARVVPSGPSAHVAEPVALSGDHGNGAGVLLAVAPGRALSAGGPGSVAPAPTAPPPSPPATPIEAQPVATAPSPSAPTVQPVPTTSPVIAGVGGGSPGTSGVPGPGEEAEGEPEESCEGDEYTIAVSSLDGTPAYESSTLEILVSRFGADGSVDEFQLEGDLDAVQALVDLLTAEGNCVQTVFEPETGETPLTASP